MKHPDRHLPSAARARILSCNPVGLSLLTGALLGLANVAQALDLAQVPLFLSPAVNPNVLVMLDNSQSMDGAMGGKMLSGEDIGTRSNAARSVLRDVIATYRNTFNWGLGSFGISGVPARFNTYGYYLGNAGTMVYTHTCTGIVDGVGVSDIVGLHAVVVGGVKTDVMGPLPCIANPEPANGFGFITFDRSGDDADVNDVTYAPDLLPQMYGIGRGDTTYSVFGARSRDTQLTGIGWSTRDFVNDRGRQTFSASDSGWVSDATVWPRRLWIARGWGFDNAITGMGTINDTVVSSQTAGNVDEAAHFDALNALLAPEDADPVSRNIKNAARYTPLAGTLETGRRYFEGRGYTSPIQSDVSCQRNFVVVATDGNPTGTKTGTQYGPTAWVNTYDQGTRLWTYGPATVDVLTEITALRATARSGQTYDIQTYVIGMGDTVANPSSVAALNAMADKGGTGRAFLASSADALRRAFQAVASDIQARTSSASSAGVSSGSWQTGAALYQAKFSSVDWSGNVLALPVGSDGTLARTPTWAAAEQLKLQNWDSGRTIITYKPSGKRGIALRWPAAASAPSATELDPAQVSALNAGGTDGHGEQRLRYLRGDSSKEARNCAGCVPQFRNRPATVLGDIIDSAPFYVGAPSASYSDDVEARPYSAFVAAHATRAPQLYVGANDGMLHGFDTATGKETLAYVPNLVFDSLSALTAIPFAHSHNVDGSPVVADAFYANDWHSLLVSGLRGGGRGLFALDVTDPSRFTESLAASIARWEFVDTDMGYVFTPPMLVKTNNGRWSVIAGNGYNSVTRHAVLYVIDAETGDLVAKIDTGPAGDNGLSGPAAIDVDGDGVVDVVYAGDLNGKLWKFDLSAKSPDAWGLAAGGGPLFDAGAGKSITSRPDVTQVSAGGFLVTFGTGRYLSSSDPGNSATQTAYGIWDKGGAAVTADQLQEQIIEPDALNASAGGDTYRLSTHRVGVPADGAIADDAVNALSRDSYFATKRGWFLDLPTAGERIVADVSIRGGRAIFTSIIPNSSDRCNFGGSGWVLEFDVLTGNRLDSATFDVNGDAALSDADYLAFGPSDAKSNASGWRIGAIPAAPAFMGFRDRKVNSEIKFINTSDGTIVQKREAAGNGNGAGGEGRVMWRVVQ